MKRTRLTTAALAVALLAAAGCSKKAPETLPPAPGDSTMGDTTGQDSGVGTEVVPGSRADFLQTVGQYGDRVFFDYDSYSIDDQDRQTLDTQAAWLMRYPNVRVTVEGHADERGTREYNLALGDRRANAAKNYLVARGIDPSRITVISYGKEQPVALGSDENSWAQNRRAVTVLSAGAGM
ncbi:MAG: peptidoglycan-associated lipoprotein Pal [Allosphingosinicella sp.]